ncbi:MAG: hypothetical protein NC903_03235, partial [Candidatus Omnitrophica bacterium]|nr:hypothetical protein [Candidatus Omnitrophota bacterium]
MRKEIIKFLIFILILVIFYSLGKVLKFDFEDLKVYFKRFNPFIAAIVFVILYVVITFFVWLSKDIFRLVSAIIFGAEISTM